MSQKTLILKHLKKSDPMLGLLIKEIGKLDLTPNKRSPYEALVRSIAHQQLTGRVAEVILGRFIALVPNKKFPEPADVLALPIEKLRSVGFSMSKATSIQQIAEFALAGKVPTRAQAKKMSSEELITQLTEIRGVGRWTVEMLLIFTLGRLDVFPVDDFGVKKGYCLHYKKRKLPTPKQFRIIAQKWQPYGSYAALYFWACADRKKNNSFLPVPDTTLT
ncbi:MAG: DNA-3-methyladenine glycosylase 2 family protein [Bacteriovoracaceae bacterium]|nr:DNA-3-methyladenine glycosylase 2 family protein [Bacteriovoracaceae bacterium]